MIASSSFCLAEYSSFSAVWLDSSQAVVSSIFELMVALSASESFEASFSSERVDFIEYA